MNEYLKNLIGKTVKVNFGGLHIVEGILKTVESDHIRVAEDSDSRPCVIPMGSWQTFR